MCVQVHSAADHPGLCADAGVQLQRLVAGAAVHRRHDGRRRCRDCLQAGCLLQGDSAHSAVLMHFDAETVSDPMSGL